MKKDRPTIYLIGFMGAGKSTAAAVLARDHGWRILEVDEEIVRREGRTIPDIFSGSGEAYFRSLETEVLEESGPAGAAGRLLVSCGGGAVLREENVRIMKKWGRIVWLRISPETVYERLKKDRSRPLLQGRQTPEGIAELMKARCSAYQAAADLILDVDDRCPEEVAQMLAEIR